eukprot:TRINITY_DN15_c0_g2_i1.p1 TRINITY_DN15_c0_g2~~TRINITY_DN15_c0_g2_i1.p1  ORF type:complete len:588 (+),score=179.37 TRINITY_DN15_c0_g2_i1:130-1893(+)
MAANSPYQSASLYVGDLHPSVSEALLFEIFKAVGTVASIRVCRDAVTRRSLGYAYVNFHSVVDAERALDTLNYTPIKGKPCRIMWSHRDPSVRKSGQGNVFIKNLDKTIDNKALYDTFSTFGNILSCKVVTDGKTNSKGYGFVHYETQEAAEQAINKVHGMLLNGKIVFVGHFVPRKERSPGSDPDKFTNLYVKHLHPETTDDELKAEFAAFGDVQSSVIMRSHEGESRKFGFVNYANHEDAVKAVEGLHGKKKVGKAEKEIYVQRAQKKNEREQLLKKIREERAQKYQGINLYVKNLDDTVNSDSLRAHFAEFGTITSCIVMTDDKTNSKGFGFVCFTTPEEASKAVTERHGSMLNAKPIYVALAERKEMRRAKLEAQYASRGRGMPGNPNIGAPVYGVPPVFYPSTQGRGQFMGYPQGVMRGRPYPAPGAGGQPRPYQGNYMVHPGAARGSGGRGRGGARNAGGQAPNSNGGRFKYTPNARNQNQGPKDMNLVPSINTSVLAQASPEETKQILGENLFSRIRAVEPTQAPKITGMLLESLEVNDLLGLLDSREALAEKIDEALQVLKNHQSADEAEPVAQPQTVV